MLHVFLFCLQYDEDEGEEEVCIALLFGGGDCIEHAWECSR